MFNDDKMGITIAENNPMAITAAKELLESNDIYHPSLTVKEEMPVMSTPGCTKYI